MMEDQRKVIIVERPFWRTLAHSLALFTPLTVALGVGIYFDSAVLQVIAGICWILFFAGKVINFQPKNIYTLDEAAEHIEELRKAEGGK